MLDNNQHAGDAGSLQSAALAGLVDPMAADVPNGESGRDETMGDVPGNIGL